MEKAPESVRCDSGPTGLRTGLTMMPPATCCKGLPLEKFNRSQGVFGKLFYSGKRSPARQFCARRREQKVTISVKNVAAGNAAMPDMALSTAKFLAMQRRPL
jgi:hypothetical protein